MKKKKPKSPAKDMEISIVDLFKLAATIALANKPLNLVTEEDAIDAIHITYDLLAKSIEEWK